MKLMALNVEERLQTGYSHKVTLYSTDLTAAATTQSISLLPTSGALTAGAHVMRSSIKLITPFTGGAISAMAFDLGDGGSAGRYIANANTDLFTALATNTKPHVASSTAYIYSPKNVSDGNAVVLGKFTATGANVSAATAGELDAYILLSDVADLVRPNSNP